MPRQLVEGLARRARRSAQDVDVEGVLPRPPPQRARLDLREVHAAGRERPQRAVEDSGRVLQGKDDRGLARVGGGSRLAGEHEETGEVLGIVLDAFQQDLSSVEARRQRGGDGGMAGGAVPEKVLHAAGGVVGRDGLDLRALGEEAPALGEGHRMGGDAAYRGQGRSRARDQALADAELGLAHDVESRDFQPVVVLVDRARERVLDGKQPAVGFARHHGREQGIEARAGKDLGVLAEDHERRGVAEGPPLALDGDLDRLLIAVLTGPL